MTTNPERPPGADARPRIGFLTTELGGGGAERIVCDLATRLDRTRFDVAGVWCLRPADGVFAARLAAAAVPCAGAGVRSPLGLPAGLIRLRRMLREARLDLLNAHLFHASAAARAVWAPRHPGRLVESYHFAGESAARWRIVRLLPGRPGAITAVSTTVAECVRRGLGLDPAAVHVIPNGVDLEALSSPRSDARQRIRAELGLPDEALVVGSVGRLVRGKDPWTLLNGFAAVASEFPRSCLVIAGEGPLGPAVAKRAAALGLSNRLRMLGFRQDIGDILAATDVFVLASRTEGHPLALIEAMAAGLPTVAARIPAVEETLGVDEAAGLTFRPGDAADLAARLAQLFRDSELMRRLGAQARDAAKRRFSVKAMVEGYERLFDLSKQFDSPDRKS